MIWGSNSAWGLQSNKLSCLNLTGKSCKGHHSSAKARILNSLLSAGLLLLEVVLLIFLGELKIQIGNAYEIAHMTIDQPTLELVKSISSHDNIFKIE